MPFAFDPYDLLASVTRESFIEFVKQFWIEVPGAGNLVWNDHIDVFCNQFQLAAERVFRNEPKEYDLIFNVPPGTSKSTCLSILTCPWVWTRMPHARFICSSHTDTLCLDLSAKARTVIKSEKYRNCFSNIVLREDQDTKGYFANTLGGDRHTCTVAGKSPMGFHGDFLICDDPLDPKKVLSEAEIKTAADFMTNVLPTRKVNKATALTVLVMQRLGIQDPTAVMLEQEKAEGAAKIRHICLPAELTEDVSPPELRSIYVDGLLDSKRLPAQVLAEFKSKGAHFYSTQFLQKPYAIGGGMFRPEYFTKRVKAAPYHARRVRYWDRASTEGESACNTAGTLVAEADGNWYFGPVTVGKWEPDRREKIQLFTAQQDRAKFGPKNEPEIVLEHEPGSSGVDQYKWSAKNLAGYRVHPDRPSGNKETRAEPLAAQFAAGNCYIVDDGTWDVEAWLKEFIAFPGGPFKDRVDSASGGFNWLLKGKREAKIRVLSAGMSRKNMLRLVVCSREILAATIIDQKALLVTIQDPIPEGEQASTDTKHGIDRLLDKLVLQFVDERPQDHLETWEVSIPPWNKPMRDLVITREHAHKLWAFVKRQRMESPQVIVLQDDGDRRAISMAFALADALRLPRSEAIYIVGDDKLPETPPNQHIYDMLMMGRDAVL